MYKTSMPAMLYGMVALAVTKKQEKRMEARSSNEKVTFRNKVDTAVGVSELGDKLTETQLRWWCGHVFQKGKRY